MFLLSIQYHMLIVSKYLDKSMKNRTELYLNSVTTKTKFKLLNTYIFYSFVKKIVQFTL